MLGSDTIKEFIRTMTGAFKRRRQQKLAKIAEIERKERQALVKTLAVKFARAHADCEQNGKKSSPVELSLKEILFIERDIQTWARHFEVRKIYERLP